ncbi:MAG: VIT and VWA domain-containing protein [Bacteroidales bacterium]|nr:VIT and VWA domain-containing protein [Bacteroidales bacterium]
MKVHFRLRRNMRTSAGENVALQSVNIDAAFTNLFCETTTTQVYRNLEKKPIEAVYTFPLASGAVLLGLKVAIGGRELKGVVTEKPSAEEKYEEAITDGNAVVMLEQLEPGLYSMNVGNILADEEARVTIIYTELYCWQGNTLRFHLPTTIAPRFGNPESVGLEPYQTPEYDLLTENRFQLKLTFSGLLADAAMDSPSHQIAISKSGNAATVTLATGNACMDRDFILNIRTDQVDKDAVLLDRDCNGGFVALASFAPRLPIADKTPPKSIKILVDCSGSMGGDSIAQARQAINDILSMLRPVDFFNLIAFGSTCKTCFKQQAQASKANITKVKRLLRSLDADMGGTEIHRALQATVQIPGPPVPQDILLITDGEVYKDSKIINTAKQSGHRIFTVGVGSSVSESFVLQLAKETGGACELVSPNENMAERITRHFKRIYLTQADIAICWPVEPVKTIPRDIGPVYDGDTLHAFACFDKQISGPVILEMTLADGRTFSQTVILEDGKNLMPGNDLPGPIARVAIHRSLTDEDEKAAKELAVKYQLISPYTNYLVVDVRAEDKKTQDLPALRKVPQMPAAGWGGVGTAFHYRSVDDVELSGDILFQLSEEPSDQLSWERRLKKHKLDIWGAGVQDSELRHKERQQTTPEFFINQCNRLQEKKWSLATLKIKSYNDLLACNLPDRILHTLKCIAMLFYPQPAEKLIVLAFLCVLTELDIGKSFSPKTRQAIRKAKKALCPSEQLVEMMVTLFAGVSKDDWGRAIL